MLSDTLNCISSFELPFLVLFSEMFQLDLISFLFSIWFDMFSISFYFVFVFI